LKKITCIIIFILSCFLLLAKPPIIIKNSLNKIVYESDNRGNIIKKDFFTFKYDDLGRVIFLGDGDINITYAYIPNPDGYTDVNVVFRKNKNRRDFSYSIRKIETPNKKTEEIWGQTIAFKSGYAQNKLLFSKEILLGDDGKPFESIEKEYVRRIGKDTTLYFMKYPIIRRFTRKIPSRNGGWTEVSYVTNEEGYYSVRNNKTFVNYITEAIYKPQSFLDNGQAGINIKTYTHKGTLTIVENNGRQFLYNYFYKGKEDEKYVDKLNIVNSGTILDTLYYEYPMGQSSPEENEKISEVEVSENDNLLENNEEISVVGNFINIDLSESIEIPEIITDLEEPIYKRNVPHFIFDR
jgi:hypothetical protein